MSSLFEDLKEASNNRYGSQYGETGIIVYLLEYLDIEPKYCVEFGAGMVHSGGFDKKKGTANIRILTSQAKYQDQIKLETITASNVNDIFLKYEVPEDLDVLVIDVDGQDYWIWKSLNYNPKIVLIEFNPSLSWHHFFI